MANNKPWLQDPVVKKTASRPWAQDPIVQSSHQNAPQTVDLGAAGGPLNAFAQGLSNAALLGYNDELRGAVRGAIPAMLSGEDVGTAYIKERDLARKYKKILAEQNPKSTIAGELVPTALYALISKGKSLGPTLAEGSALGAILGYGQSDAPTLEQQATDTAIGAATGGAGAGIGHGLGSLIGRVLPSGHRDAVIRKYGSEIVDAIQKGEAPAAANVGLQQLSSDLAEKAPTVAQKYLPEVKQAAEEALGRVGPTLDEVLPPANAASYLDDLEKRTKGLVAPIYKSAGYKETVQVPEELLNNPFVQDLFPHLEKLANAEGRRFNPKSITGQELDLIQRTLRGRSAKLFASENPETITAAAMGKYGQDANEALRAAVPGMAESQTVHASKLAARDAVEAGKAAARAGKSVDEVALEYSQLSPDLQEAYKTGFSTVMRVPLASKTAKGMERALTNKNVIDKLTAMGVDSAKLAPLAENVMKTSNLATVFEKGIGQGLGREAIQTGGSLIDVPKSLPGVLNKSLSWLTDPMNRKLSEKVLPIIVRKNPEIVDLVTKIQQSSGLAGTLGKTGYLSALMSNQ